jgi:ISXO2-like transposase domain
MSDPRVTSFGPEVSHDGDAAASHPSGDSRRSRWTEIDMRDFDREFRETGFLSEATVEIIPSIREYVRDDVHTNSIEGVWALLKRQIIGIHHWVSPKHLDAYVAELTFRFNRRDVPKGDRVNALLS